MSNPRPAPDQHPALARQPQPLQDLTDRQAFLVKGGEGLQGLLDVQEIEEACVLKLHPYGRANGPGFMDDRVAGHLHQPLVGPAQPFQDLQGGGLPRTVGPQKAENLAFVHSKTHVVDRDELPVPLHQPFHPDHSPLRQSGPSLAPSLVGERSPAGEAFLQVQNGT